MEAHSALFGELTTTNETSDVVDEEWFSRRYVVDRGTKKWSPGDRKKMLRG